MNKTSMRGHKQHVLPMMGDMDGLGVRCNVEHTAMSPNSYSKIRLTWLLNYFRSCSFFSPEMLSRTACSTLNKARLFSSTATVQADVRHSFHMDHALL